jgi:hypothetical protein
MNANANTLVTEIRVGDVFTLRQGGEYIADRVELTRSGKVRVDCHQTGDSGWHRSVSLDRVLAVITNLKGEI